MWVRGQVFLTPFSIKHVPKITIEGWLRNLFTFCVTSSRTESKKESYAGYWQHRDFLVSERAEMVVPGHNQTWNLAKRELLREWMSVAWLLEVPPTSKFCVTFGYQPKDKLVSILVHTITNCVEIIVLVYTASPNTNHVLVPIYKKHQPWPISLCSHSGGRRWVKQVKSRRRRQT